MNILDVDFRYVMRDSYQNEITRECFTMPIMVKVLQWRKRMMKHEFGGLHLEE